MLNSFEFGLDFMQKAPIAIGGVDKTKTKFFINDFFTEIFGWTLDDFSSMQQWFEKAYPNENYRNMMIKLWKKVIKETRNSNKDFSEPIMTYITCKDKSVKMIELRYYQKNNMHFGFFYNLSEQENLYDNTQLKQNQMKVSHLYYVDEVTGLPNKHKLILQLDDLLQKNKDINSDKKSALFLIDISRFSHINDSFGFEIGDEILKEITRRLEFEMISSTIIASLGGDKFVMVMENIQSLYEIEWLAEQLIDIITKPYLLSNNIELYINVCIGVVNLSESDYNTNEILKYSSTALYRAKVEGKNSFKLYNKDFSKEVDKYLKIQNELHEALKNNELELFYQPQVDSRDDKIIGAEALIKWKHPKKGYISPDKFIPIAEDSKLISKIGEWVINEACRQAKSWEHKGYDLTMSVNVAIQQFRYQNLIKVIDNALSSSGLDSEKLILELTESALIDDSDFVYRKLLVLKGRGIHIAIDDFGTGYSSYGYLKRFPINYLKIDKIFIDNVPRKKTDSAILKAIIEMSKTLRYKIVVEGVEKKDQLNFLSDLNCHYYQGYLKSKPLCASDFELLLLENESK